jgi:hypothetical protein
MFQSLRIAFIYLTIESKILGFRGGFNAAGAPEWNLHDARCGCAGLHGSEADFQG